jgi:sulfite reductase alpha subunit-like flavoprotein
MLMPLSPRPYSLCSCLDTDNELEIIFNLIQLDASQARTYKRLGIATGYLSNLLIDNKFYFSKRTMQNFTLSKDSLNKPVIMISHGTGIAPFISFLRFKKFHVDKVDSGDWWLFYGCRHPTSDFLYKNEMLTDYASQTHILSNFYVTFSRATLTDPNSDLNKYYVSQTKYVQDIIRVKSKELCDLIVNQNAMVYVCGDENSMTKDVFSCFVDCINNEFGDKVDNAQSYLLEMMNTKRYKQDIWI